MTDLSDLEKNSDTVVVELQHPHTFNPIMLDDGKTPMFVEVYGKYSERYKKIQTKQQDSRLKRAQRSGGRAPVSAEELTAERLSLVVACVKSWNIVFKGVTPECVPAEIQIVFEKLPWVRDQVEEAMEDSQRFLKS